MIKHSSIFAFFKIKINLIRCFAFPLLVGGAVLSVNTAHWVAMRFCVPAASWHLVNVCLRSFFLVAAVLNLTRGGGGKNSGTGLDAGTWGNCDEGVWRFPVVTLAS